MPLADGVSQFVVRSSVRNWFAANHALPEILPVEVREAHQYMTRYDAFKMMHFPDSSQSVTKRLVINSLMKSYLSCNLD